MKLPSWLSRTPARPPQLYRLPLTRDERETRNFKRTLVALGFWTLGATIVLLICCLRIVLAHESETPWGDAFALFCHGAMLSMAFASVGGLVGFLFAIPPSDASGAKAKQNDSSDPKAEGTSGATSRHPTNLEQIADWLTKIILGAGLTQLMRIPEKLKNLGFVYKADFGDSLLLPQAIAVHSAILGFFVGYLITRLFLASAFATADSAASDAANSSNVLRVADAQAAQSNYVGATATFENAIASLGPDAPRETKLLYYERLTYNALYEAPPSGFQKAIDYVTRFLTQESQQPPSALLYFNLACAYGQLYDWEKRNQNREAVLKDARDRALNAVRNTLQLDPSQKSILQLVWNPQFSKLRDEENDLESFYEDPDFRALLT